MKRGETYSSGYLKAQDMLDQGHDSGLTLTIKSIRTSEMDDGKVQRVVSFREDDRDLGLNVTNWDAIAAITGEDDDDNWVGHKIHVYPHRLDRPYNGRTHGIRVRAPGASAARAMPAAAPNEAAWSWDMAKARAGAAGIDQPSLIELLKQQGNKGWNPERDTPLVQQWIKDAQAQNVAQPPFGDEPQFKADEMPF